MCQIVKLVSLSKREHLRRNFSIFVPKIKKSFFEQISFTSHASDNRKNMILLLR